MCILIKYPRGNSYLSYVPLPFLAVCVNDDLDQCILLSLRIKDFQFNSILEMTIILKAYPSSLG